MLGVMPSRAHEALVELVRSRPALIAELLRGLLGVTLPTYVQTRLESGDLSQLQPTEYRADAVVALSDVAGRPVAAVVVEVQRHCDKDKRFVWPVYLATLRSRWQCDVLLVVIATDAAVARWCAMAIPIGHPGWVLEPLVVGPEAIPVVTDKEQAWDQPWLAVLSSLAHYEHAQRDAVFDTFLDAMASLDETHADLYIDIVMAGLPEVARSHLEELMATGTYEFKSDWARRHHSRGVAEGEANAIITVLTSRGVEVPEAARDRITSCSDTAQLTAWLERAATARTIDDVFT